jgi:hypothetical protein
MPEPEAPDYQPIDPPASIPIDIPSGLLFSIGSAVLMPRARAVLSEAAVLLTGTYPSATADLGCYADSATGTPAINF